jgi:tetratricopeptide (TPR) repeat protein
MPDESFSFQANLQRGRLLREQGRYADAEKFLQSAIGEEASNAIGYFELAFCYCNWGEHSPQALQAIDRAIGLDPTRAEFFALRAWILGNLDKHQESLQAAKQALELNPDDTLALNAKARTYIDLKEWSEAETAARQSLAINTDDEVAGNILAIALRQQGRLRESEALTASMLSQAPEDALSQSNAGWSALQAGDYRRANRHFLEALRLNPNFDNARKGLVHAFNSRVWIYRIYFQYLAWMSKHKTGMRYFIVFTIYVAYRYVIGTIRVELGHKSGDWIAVVVAFYFIFFGFGRSFGNFFLLLDPFARHALGRKEIVLSSLVMLAYSFLLFVVVWDKAWPQTAILVALPACFVWAALWPRIQDALSTRSGIDGAAADSQGPLTGNRP